MESRTLNRFARLLSITRTRRDYAASLALGRSPTAQADEPGHLASDALIAASGRSVPRNDSLDFRAGLARRDAPIVGVDD